MKPKVIYYECLNYQKKSIDLLNKIFNLEVLKKPSLDDYEIIGDAEAIFCPLGYLFNKERLQKYKKLRVLGSNTTGHPHIDIAFCKKKNIKVVTLKNKKKFLKKITATPELTLGLIIMITRNILPASKSVLDGNWSRWEFGGLKMLSSMKLGIVGLGRIGNQLAKYADALNMKISYYDPMVTNKKYKKFFKLTELAKNVDILSIHVPHKKNTENLIDSKILSCMKKNSFLINTSRGEIIDWEAVLKYLKNSKLKGVAMDVFDGEFKTGFKKKIQNHPFLNYAKKNDNVILTPHIGGSTIESWQMTEIETIKTVENYLNIKKEE